MEKLSFGKVKPFLIGGLFSFSPLVLSQEAAPSPVSNDVIVAMDTMWVLITGMLVFSMQLGFAMLESGLHSNKNVINVFMKNLVDFLIGSIFFLVIGFGLMFGDGNPFFGTEGFLLKGNFSSLNWTKVPLEAKFFFQLVFAGTAATIISGAIGGRVKFITYIYLSVFVSAFVYPILGHWIWGGGWLAQQGMFDFAGSTVVHLVGGASALGAAIVAGPRIGRFNKDGSANPMPPFSLTMMGTGVFFLWLGWFGFNPGSTMAIFNSAELASHVVLTTNTAAAAGGLTTMFLSWILMKKPDYVLTFNGVLAGLVAITAGCAYVSVWSSILIAVSAGIVFYFSCILLEKLHIDDAVGAFPMHGMCGMWGTICVGLFAEGPWAGGSGQPGLGLFFGGGVKQLWVQTYGTLAVGISTFIVIWVGGKLMNAVVGVRVSEKEEIAGLDLTEHGLNDEFKGDRAA